MRRQDQMSHEMQRACGEKPDEGWHATMKFVRERSLPTFWITDGSGHTLDVCTSLAQAMQSQAFTRGAKEIWRRGPAGGMELLKIRKVA